MINIDKLIKDLDNYLTKEVINNTYLGLENYKEFRKTIEDYNLYFNTYSKLKIEEVYFIKELLLRVRIVLNKNNSLEALNLILEDLEINLNIKLNKEDYINN